MQRKISVTEQEYLELQRLAQIVNDRNSSIGQRRIAKAQYEAILRLAKNRPISPTLKQQKTIV
jgi:hypothetical protein